MNHLYYLEPLGIGTDGVESFTSYLHRLATAHGVSLSQLINQIRRVDARTPGDHQPGDLTTAKPKSTAIMVRPTLIVRDLVASTQRLTGCKELRCTTFLALSRMDYRSSRLFHPQLRWCPLCWLDDLNRRRPAYYRLIWSLLEVDRCHRHACRLEVSCPACGKFQCGTGWHPELHRCESKACGHSLIDPQVLGPELLPKFELPWPDLKDLVMEISADPTLEYDPNAAKSLLTKMYYGVWDLAEERAQYKLIPRIDALAMFTSEKPLTIKALRRTAQWLGIGFTELLAGRVACWTAQLDPMWLSELPTTVQSPSQRTLTEQKALREDFSDVLNTIDLSKPPPLTQVARQLNITTFTLERVYPELSRLITDRRKQWLKVQLNAKRVVARIELWKYLNSNGRRCTRKKMLQELKIITGLPTNLLRDVIKQELDRHGFTDDSARVRRTYLESR